MALLDDVVMISKLAAASLDDALGQAAKAGSKAAGVVIDDAAVTPKYVVGLSPQRELPMIWKIAKGSLVNKLLLLLPVALALDYFAPWLITPLLMIGGVYLCYEGAEKLLEYVAPHAAHDHEEDIHGETAMSAEALETSKVKGAVRTDFILSAEIMAITLANVSDGLPVPTNTQDLLVALATKAISIGLVGVAITAAVYGVVGLIVKADDIGLRMARNSIGSEGLRKAVAATGHGLVNGMPKFLSVLAAIGTAAMLWVGGSILIHGLAALGFADPEHVIHHWAETVGHLVPDALTGPVSWLTSTSVQGVLGIVVGAITIPLVGKVIAPLVTAVMPKRKTA
jgi:predicted DNA repair protein MutK